MEPAILILSVIVILLNIVILYRMHKLMQHQPTEHSEAVREERLRALSEQLAERLSAMEHSMEIRQDMTLETIALQMKQLEHRFRTLESGNDQRMEALRDTIHRQLRELQTDNAKRMEQIRNTVDEHLQTTLSRRMNESFRLVNDRLEQVYKGLGEMQSIAVGVGDLKKVLSNVKNRGILGELQLGAILQDILAPEQYAKEIPTIPSSSNHVEFAVRLPGSGEQEQIWLPIDSKFPGDTYTALQEAYESGDSEQIKAAKKQLDSVLRKCAKDIREKYVMPPYTTRFAILFLPFEGLYAEVVNSDLPEQLQRQYQITIAGPSTMAAMLNALQMGFCTLTIQKRSNEVWEILGAVKSEFETFASALEETQKHIKRAEDDLEKLVGVRTRQINRKLRSIETGDHSVFSLITEET